MQKRDTAICSQGSELSKIRTCEQDSNNAVKGGKKGGNEVACSNLYVAKREG